MNTASPDVSRRRFLTRLFTAPDAALAKTELTTVAALRRQTNGVLWAVAGDAPDNIFVAGDDGVVFHFDGEHWQREDLSRLLFHTARKEIDYRRYGVRGPLPTRRRHRLRP